MSSESRFIITGTGRSGTAFISRVLQTLGILSGHEQVWNAFTPEEGDWADWEGEVGWEAAGHLDGFGGPVVHVTRNPVDVINSRLGSNWYTYNPNYSPPDYKTLYDYVDSRIDLRQYESRWDQAAWHYVAWTRMIGQHGAKLVQLESLDIAEMESLLLHIGHGRTRHWIDFALRAVSPTTNQHTQQKLVTWDSLWSHVEPSLFADLVGVAERYGYDVVLSG